MEYSVCTCRWTNESDWLEREAGWEDIGTILSLATDRLRACRGPCPGRAPLFGGGAADHPA
jgi:hypothetical protein